KQTLAVAAESVLQSEAPERTVLVTQALPSSRRRARPAEPEPAILPGAEPAPVVATGVAPEIPPPPPERVRTEEAPVQRRTATDTKPVAGEVRDPERSRKLAEEDSAALRAGRRAEAASLFNQAIALDRRNAAALMGLSDIYFDTGETQKAVNFAEKGVEAAPGNASYRLKLGDAYFKALLYHDALRQYEEAKVRGAPQAEARVTKVRAKLGG